MLRVLCRLQYQLHYYIQSTNPKTTIYNLGFLVYLQKSHLSTISATPSSKTIDYLVKSCGLDPKVALLASKKFQLRDTEKPDLVLNLLRNCGFTDAHLKDIVSKNPKILTFYPDQILKPRIAFLSSLGVSVSELAKILMIDINFLKVGLESKIIPASNFLKRLFTSHGDFVLALKYSIRYFNCNFEGVVVVNIATLRSYGVGDGNILYVLKNYPRALVEKNDRFKMMVEAVMGRMGLDDPSKLCFVEAVRVMCSLKESSWNRRWEAYQELGFSNEEILAIFKRSPNCLMTSEEKIRKGVDFFTRKLNWDLADITVCPLLLRLSLEKRVIPRCTVLEFLNSNGIIKKKMDVHSLSVVLKLSEKDFLQKFVVQYQQTVPEVVNAYKGTIGLEMCEFKIGPRSPGGMRLSC